MPSLKRIDADRDEQADESPEGEPQHIPYLQQGIPDQGYKAERNISGKRAVGCSGQCITTVGKLQQMLRFGEPDVKAIANAPDNQPVDNRLLLLIPFRGQYGCMESPEFLVINILPTRTRNPGRPSLRCC